MEYLGASENQDMFPQCSWIIEATLLTVRSIPESIAASSMFFFGEVVVVAAVVVVVVVVMNKYEEFWQFHSEQ